MSQLDQAKREATRLFKLAKENKLNNNSYQLTIKNLSHAKEHIARINGYNNWHDYEENLIKKDLLNNKQSKSIIKKDEEEIISDLSFFIKEMNFNFNYDKREKSYDFQLIKHQSITLGSCYKDGFLKKEKKDWCLNSYPMYISGSTGSGKSEVFVSLMDQYIENKEGCIYLDSKGDLSLTNKVYSLATRHNRQKDFFLLNFLKDSKSYNYNTNTIDPINPILDNEFAMKTIFGEKVGFLIHKIGMVAKKKQLLLDVGNLENILMIPSLINWSKDSFWEDATKDIVNYLEDINLFADSNEEDCENALKLHAINCIQAKKMVDFFKTYSEMFSINPEIDIVDVFVKRKILLINFPALEKSLFSLRYLGFIILSQIEKAAKECESFNLRNTLNFNNGSTINIWQNIILDGIDYLIIDEHKDQFFSNLTKSTNWIFGNMNFYNSERIIKALSVSNTYVLMKLADSISDIPSVLKVKFTENTLGEYPIFNKEMGLLRELRGGEAYVFGNNPNPDFNKNSNLLNNKSYNLSKIKTIYKDLKYTSEIVLNK